MRDLDLKANARLRVLAREVLEPLFADIERREGIRYRVRTPYDLVNDHVMNDVIHAIDRADLVVADLTFSNPNVFYELGLTHSLGRACVAIKEESYQQTEFDIRAYRYYNIDLNERRFLEAQQTLRPAIERAHREISDWSRFENPVIDFFRAPVTYISPAFAVAQGYYLNFVKPVVEAIIKRRGARYSYDIGFAALDAARPNSIEDVIALTAMPARQNLQLNILIPGRIHLAKHNYADRFRGVLPAALVEGDGRSYSCFGRNEASETPHLIDIPTTMRVLEDAVDRRMHLPNTPSESLEWREVEDQEIERFTLNLQLFIDRHDDNPEFKEHVQILRYDPDRPGGLLWLHNILNRNRA